MSLLQNEELHCYIKEFHNVKTFIYKIISFDKDSLCKYDQAGEMKALYGHHLVKSDDILWYLGHSVIVLEMYHCMAPARKLTLSRFSESISSLLSRYLSMSQSCCGDQRIHIKC